MHITCKNLYRRTPITDSHWSTVAQKPFIAIIEKIKTQPFDVMHGVQHNMHLKASHIY